MTTAPRPFYRADLDGFRALACVIIFIYHAGLEFVPAATLAVDGFFILSGYLLAKHAWSAHLDKTFSFARYYQKRARRVLAPLLVMLLICTLVAYWTFLPDDLDRYADSVIATIAYISNFYMAAQVDYFAPAAAVTPLVHTWSIATEEQFYVGLPLLLLSLSLLGRNWAKPVFIILFIVALWLGQWTADNMGSGAHYLLPGRIWEFLLGMAVGMFWPQSQQDKFRGVISQTISLFGMALFLFYIFTFSYEAINPPSFNMLPPLLGLCLFIMFSHPRTLTYRLMSWPVLVGIGQASYSFYLWHYPLFAFWRYRTQEPLSITEILIIALIMVPISWVSWKYVEQPFRNTKQTSLRMFVGCMVAIAALTLGLAVYANQTKGDVGRWGDTYETIIESQTKPPIMAHCKFHKNYDQTEIDACVQSFGNRPHIYLLGDSLARGFSPSLRAKLALHNIGLVTLYHPGCMPFDFPAPLHFERSKTCIAFFEQVHDYLKTRNEPVIIMALWRGHLTGPSYDNGRGGIKLKKMDQFAPYLDRLPERIPYIREEIKKLAAQHPLILIGPTPEAGWRVPEKALQVLQSGGDINDIGTGYQWHRAKTKIVGQILDDLPSVIPIIDSASLICDAESDFCPHVINGTPLYYDHTHLARPYADMLADAIVDGQLKILLPQHSEPSR